MPKRTNAGRLRSWSFLLLAMAVALMLRKDVAKARGQLKKLLRLPVDSERADDFVQGWLMFADTLAEASPPKLADAQDALRRALELDASCARAHEFLGGIAEAERRWADAASCYERAWAADFEKSAPVGYKLAFNYLKSGRLVETVLVAGKVLAQFPEYLAIADLRARARGMMRP